MSEQFIKLHSWMTEIGLSGNELIVFAVIHHYTQWKGGYSGGMEPLMQLTGVGRRSAFYIVDKLIKKNLVALPAPAKGRNHSTYVSLVNRATDCTDEENEPCNGLHSTVQNTTPNRATDCTLLDNRYIDNPPTPLKGGSANADAKPERRRRPSRSYNRALNYIHGETYTKERLKELGVSFGEELYGDDETVQTALNEIRT